MNGAHLLHELIEASAYRLPHHRALTFNDEHVDYGTLADNISAFAGGLLALGLKRAERVAIFLESRPETVIAVFGTATAGGAFVPLNPLLKPEQVAYVLRDCNVRVLVTSAKRLALLETSLAACGPTSSNPAAPRIRRLRLSAPDCEAPSGTDDFSTDS